MSVKTNGIKKGWDKCTPNQSYFNELQRVSTDQIIYGGNYFTHYLPQSRCWIYWRKLMGGDFSDGELLWTSFDKVVKEYTKCPKGYTLIHPTQKPVALYKWLLHNYAKEGDLILDTHVGSASSLIACEDMGFKYVGYELDPDYYKAASKRLQQFINQLKLF